MKCIMVMYDTLNRRHLSPYGCDRVRTPNFQRLAQRAVTFDNAYVCSMPCIPARRDFHTARPNFLHRSWGPLEPFDDSMPQMLSQAGVYTHLVTDHHHYFEDGGVGYHTRYNSWEYFRGQAGDFWKGQVADPPIGQAIGQNALKNAQKRADRVNRLFQREEHEMPQAQTFAAGIDFIRRNRGQDNWFLQLETFDPHEPFVAPRMYHDLYEHRYNGPTFDWPLYDKVTETAEQAEHMRMSYAALVSMCDAKLGDVLDVMDELDLWKDTMLVVWTDHGLFLGERGLWGKMRMPWYDELARIPFFIWDPRTGAAGERRDSLVQPAIDLPVTLLDFFGVPASPRMLGKNLRPALADYSRIREAGIFGIYGGQVNVTDGRWLYMRATQDPSVRLSEYTLMPCQMTRPFTLEELSHIELTPPLPWAQNLSVMKITNPAGQPYYHNRFMDEAKRNLLFNMRADPGQEIPVRIEAVESRMTQHLSALMRECEAPAEQFQRLGLA